jgi:hypothetical protein
LLTIQRGVPVNKALLVPNNWNPNKTTARQQEAIAESLEKYDQILDLVVRPHPTLEGKYEIIDGEHRYQALTGDTVYVTIVNGLDEFSARKLTVILNETRGQADRKELAELLAELTLEYEGAELQECLPYTAEELTDLLKLAECDTEKGEGLELDDIIGADPTESQFTKIICLVPNEALDVVQQAYDLIAQERSLNSDKQIAWGQVLESLSADYLAGAKWSQ